MERYLGGEEIDTATLIDDLETAVARGSFHPVVPVCAIGRRRPRRAAGGAGRRVPVAAGAPAAPRSSGIDGSARPPLTADPDGPLAAEVVRTSADAYVGRVSLVRVFSGTLRPETSVHVSGHVPRPDHGRRATPPTTAATTPTSASRTSTSPLGAQLREVEACVAGDIAR